MLSIVRFVLALLKSTSLVIPPLFSSHRCDIWKVVTWQAISEFNSLHHSNTIYKVCGNNFIHADLEIKSAKHLTANLSKCDAPRSQYSIWDVNIWCVWSIANGLYLKLNGLHLTPIWKNTKSIFIHLGYFGWNSSRSTTAEKQHL